MFESAERLHQLNMTMLWTEVHPWIFAPPYSNLQAFKHTPLEQTSGHDEIRLLCRTETSLSSDLTEWEVQHFRIDGELPPYVAISYTWGSDLDRRPILIDGAIFWIRRGLHRFLRQFYRSKYNARYMWVDQICIAQDLVSERNHQVQLMSFIYSKADIVLVWLGIAGASDDLAFDMIQRRRAYWRGKSSRVNSLQHRKDATKALNGLFRKAYWHRLWILQELIFATSAEIWCGELVAQWSDIKHVCKLYQNDFIHGNKVADETEVLDVPLCVVQAACDSESTTLRPYIDTVIAYGGNGCADPRDKIFGLQSMIAEDQRLKVDYSCCKEEVYIQAVLHFVREYNKARIGHRDRRLGFIDNLAANMDIELGGVSITMWAINVFHQPMNSLEELQSWAWLRCMLQDAVFGERNVNKAWAKARDMRNSRWIGEDIWSDLGKTFIAECKERGDPSATEPSMASWLSWCHAMHHF